MRLKSIRVRASVQTVRTLALLLALAGVASTTAIPACSSKESAAEGAPFDAGPLFEGGGACNAVVEQHPEEGFQHVAVCSPVTYATNPPSSGNHYPVWAAYRSYDIAVPHGFTVHNLEHGAVVVSYNCPSGCADEISRVNTWLASLPADPDCESSGTKRVIVVPDPTLDVPFAAAAWTWTMRADCFDETSFTKFYEDHLGMGRELICESGQDFEADPGSLPADCGP